MRAVHIADLHAGKTLGKVGRNPDLEYALAQVLDCVKENKVELVLIAGDVFDKANPDNESKELIFEFFLRLKDLRCEVVVISGNHDSYDFMKSIRGLSRLAGVHIYDRPSKDRFVYTYKDVKIACLPYPSERVLTSAGEDSKKTYAQLVSRFIGFLAREVKDARFKVLLAHLFIAGSRYTNTEREATITQHYAVNPSDLTEMFDYVALGHIHRYQKIERAPTTAYYTGSMYQLDFSEAKQDKFFNMIIFEKPVPKIEKIRLSLKNPLRIVHLKQDEIRAELDSLKKLEGYLKAVVHINDRINAPSDMELLRNALGDKLIKVELLTPGTREHISPQVKSMDPLELYREYYKLSYEKEMPQGVEEIFLKLLKKAQRD